MDNRLDYIPDFENLLRTKSFTELTSSEKVEVLKYLTAEEYESMKNNTARIVESFTEEEKYLVIDNNLEKILRSHMHKKEEKSLAKIITLIIGFKIPVYQMAILILTGLLLIPNNSSKVTDRLIPVYKVDTVFVEKPVIHAVSEKSHNKTRIVYPSRKSLSNQQYNTFDNVLLNQNDPYFVNIVTYLQNEKTGRPIENDPNLYWRLVTIQSMGN
jgi:hypothetical protein